MRIRTLPVPECGQKPPRGTRYEAIHTKQYTRLPISNKKGREERRARRARLPRGWASDRYSEYEVLRSAGGEVPPSPWYGVGASLFFLPSATNVRYSHSNVSLPLSLSPLFTSTRRCARFTRPVHGLSAGASKNTCCVSPRRLFWTVSTEKIKSPKRRVNCHGPSLAHSHSPSMPYRAWLILGGLDGLPRPSVWPLLLALRTKYELRVAIWHDAVRGLTASIGSLLSSAC